MFSGGRGDVAQASKPAVSQVSKPAGCTRCPKPSECSYRVRLEGRASWNRARLTIHRLRMQSRRCGV